MQYKVLTLWEPWASLVVTGKKKIETRPRPITWTIEKGTYLIHAAKIFTKEQKELCFKKQFVNSIVDCAEEYGTDYDIYTGKTELIVKFHFGCIIGSVEVKECILIPPDFKKNKMFGFIFANYGISLNEREIAFGDYTPGRYAWILQNPKVLETPIPYKGGQGYYQNFKGDVKDLIFK